MGRQIGAALGVAVLVAVLGASATTVGAFHSARLITVVAGLLTGLALAAIGAAVPRTAPAPVVTTGAATGAA
jgi:hypothetical protein